MYPAVGVEIGTKFMKIAAFATPSSAIITWENKEGSYDIPLYYNTEKKTIGRIAKETEPHAQRANIVYGVTHFLGATDKDPMIKSLFNLKTFNFSISYDRRSSTFSLNGIPVNTIGSLFFQQIKEISQTKTQQYPKSLVVAVPTHFPKEQRNNIAKAFEQAGLVRPFIFSESTALIYNYVNHMGMDAGTFAHVNIGVTLEMSIINVTARKFTITKNCVYPIFISDILDNMLLEMVLKKFSKENNLKLSDLHQVSATKMSELLAKCKDAKYFFGSSGKHTNIVIRSFFNKKDLDVNISYDEYSNQIDPIVTLVSNFADIISEYEPFCVFVTGSSAKLKCLRDAIEDSFDKGTVISPDADYSISLGAAQMAINPNAYKEVLATPEFLTEELKEVNDYIQQFRKIFGHSLAF